MLARANMISIAAIVLLHAAIAHAAPEPCTSGRSQLAFLNGVVEGLPHSEASSMCSVASNSMTVAPDEMGVSHFVLPGFIPKQFLGEEDQTWKQVTHAEQAYTSTEDSHATVMHLWLRAVCTG